jgi:nitroreductase
MTNKPASTQTPIDELIAKRWSPRSFDGNRPVEDEKVLALMEAARWAPSCFNEQPWRYIICNKHKNEVAWQFALSCLVEKNQLWAKNAPILMTACANTKFTHNGNDNNWALYDTGKIFACRQHRWDCLHTRWAALTRHERTRF